jgi:ATP-dependent Clp protease ATP-binding subunit ClpB
VTGQRTISRIVLEPGRKSSKVENFERQLRGKIVGQDEAVCQLVNTYEMALAGMTVPGRPMANLLFLGPTGSGKTRIIEAAAEILFGNANAVVKVDCAEFQHSHEIAKLLGSPPGYIGHRETQAMLTQEAVNRHQTDTLKMTFLLFDEIEKASTALWQLLLGVLDKGILTLGDNQRVDLSRTVLVMTSNLGSEAMSRWASGGIGFTSRTDSASMLRTEKRMDSIALDAARRHFSPEFMNRLDKVIVFHILSPAQLLEILDIELVQVHHRIRSTQPEHDFMFQCTPAAKDVLIREGTDARYGARHLKRAIERYLVLPLTRLISTSQIRGGDIVTADVASGTDEFVFTKDESAAELPPAVPRSTDTASWECYAAGLNREGQHLSRN